MVTCERCHRKFATYAALKQHYGNQHPNVKWTPELESKLTGEREVEAYRSNLSPKRGSNSKLIIAVVLILIVAGAAWYYVSTNSGSGSTVTGDPTLSICITDSTVLAEHIHPQLQIVVNGRPVTIPANVGISAACLRPIHTHDETGEIHVESPVVYPYTLHDFFLVWGQPFDSTQVLQYKADTTHTLKMTVNGTPNSDFQNYVMHDGDQIVITYAPSS